MSIMRLKFAFNPIIGGVWGDEPNGGKNDMVCVRVADFDDSTGRVSSDRLTMRNISASEQKGRLLQQGDLLLEKSGGGDQTSVGRSVLFDHDFRAVSSNFIALLRPRQEHHPYFLVYLLRALYHGGGSVPHIKQTTGIQNLDCNSYLNRKFNFPPQDAECRIATYLDEQTEKIDRLMDMRRRQMALLKEQRSALIQQAVTRGLNPNVPMKDSGLPWLGEIPEHWHCAPLRRFWEVIDCKHLTVPFLDEGYPLASVSEVQSFELDLSQAKRTSEEFWKSLIEGERQPRPGDLIYCRNTSVGAAAYVSSNEPIAMGQDVCLIRSSAQNGRYLNYFLRSGFMTEQLNTILVGATFKRINVADIKALIVLCPSKLEQDDIVEFIDSESNKLDTLHAAYNRQIITLTEYRTALIHECVTGQRLIPEAASL